MKKFSEIVEEVQKLNGEQLEELHDLTEKYLAEERRKKILQSYKKAKSDYKKGKLKGSRKIDELKRMLDD
ncbi:MAG: hypothetical protein K1X86_03125 [Ignavibacteria bacterium]|nr:hypothetical protein [Ignavibacteria bacterium]